MTQMRTLVVCLSLTLFAVNASAEPSKKYLKCQRLIQGVANGHLKGARKVEARHRAKVRNMLAPFDTQGTEDGDIASSIQEAVGRIVARYDTDSYRHYYGQGTVDEMMGELGPDGPDFRCSRQSTYRYTSRTRLQAYGNRLEQIREEIGSRLAVESLSKNEGLAVIAFQAVGNAERIHINRLGTIGGNIEFGPVKDSEYFRIYKVPAGRYRWDRVTRSSIFGKYRYDWGSNNLDFEVVAGKLNITGYFVFDDNIHYATGRLQHRPGLVTWMLEQRYPDLLERFEIANGLVPDEKFVEYYLQQKNALNEVAPNVE